MVYALDMASVAISMEVKKKISAQEKWSNADEAIRYMMLDAIGEQHCYTKTSWKKLPYIIKSNLDRKTWEIS